MQAPLLRGSANRRIVGAILMKIHKIGIASVLALHLAACGDGGGVNSTPTPTPTPTTTAIYGTTSVQVSGTSPNQALSSLTSGRSMTYTTNGTTATAAIPTAGGTVNASGSASLSLTAAFGLQAYQLTLTVTSSSDPAISAGATATLLNYSSWASLNYVDYGIWTIGTSATELTNKGAFVGGKPGVTASASVPVSGTASYSDYAVGYVSQANSTSTYGSSGNWTGNATLTL